MCEENTGKVESKRKHNVEMLRNEIKKNIFSHFSFYLSFNHFALCIYKVLKHEAKTNEQTKKLISTSSYFLYSLYFYFHFFPRFFFLFLSISPERRKSYLYVNLGLNQLDFHLFIDRKYKRSMRLTKVMEISFILYSIEKQNRKTDFYISTILLNFIFLCYFFLSRSFEHYVSCIVN